MSLEVASRTAIVTGAGSGINYAFAKLLLSKKCNVVLADLALRPEAQELLVKYSSSSTEGARAIFQKTDVTDWKQLDDMFECARAAFGGADIVCPGAGVYEPPFSSFWYPPGTPPSTDDQSQSRYGSLDINITHPIRCTQLAIAHFLSLSRPGVIIHVSSTAGQAPFLPTPLYVAAKHAINGFVRSLARLEDPPQSSATGEMLPKIRVCAVAPGLIRTPLWTEHPEKMRFLEEERTEWCTPDEVAEVMLELVEKKEHIGGTILEVGLGGRRRVEAFMDPGPKANGDKVTKSIHMDDEAWACLNGLLGKK